MQQTAKALGGNQGLKLRTKIPAQKKINDRLAGEGIGMMFSFQSIIFQIMARNKTNCKNRPLRYGSMLKFLLKLRLEGGKREVRSVF